LVSQFYHFLHFFIIGLALEIKEKGKQMNSIGSNPAQVGPLASEVRAPAPAVEFLQQGPWGFN
jgi:hypothetical protein